MEILYLCLPPFLAAAKVTVQGAYSKKRTKTLSDLLLYNAFVVFFAAAVVAIMFVRSVPSPAIWGYAAISGVLVILFQCSYTEAFKHGSVALTVIINSFNIVFSLVAGVLFFDEKWTILGGAGVYGGGVLFDSRKKRRGEKSQREMAFLYVDCFYLVGIKQRLVALHIEGCIRGGKFVVYRACERIRLRVFDSRVFYCEKKRACEGRSRGDENGRRDFRGNVRGRRARRRIQLYRYARVEGMGKFRIYARHQRRDDRNRVDFKFCDL